MTGIQFTAVASFLRTAAALQQAHVPPADSVVVKSPLPDGIAHSAADSIVVQSPLPGGIAHVVRFLLNTVPQWVQIGGVVLGVAVAAFVIWFLYTRRVAIRAWLASRTSGVKLAIAAVAVVLIAGTAALGTVTWNYTQHSNDFCSGCHIMNPAFQKFGAEKNKHAKLSCHDCHQQSLYASARQVYLWVAERPEKIGPHARVPNNVCETCHITKDTAAWQRVASTAGHRVHLESDSSALKNIQCVKCHGVELHRFASVNETCGQSGCHKPSETNIALGKMAEQTDLHCISCHAFTADVPLLATRDSARGTLVPGKPECLGCHKMQKVLADFDAAKDPHGGKCGTCHNPHVQKTAAAAANSCTTSGCHANWRDTPFHVGASHKQIASRCLTCHLPHAAKVDASNCEGCHLSVRSRGGLRPPLPFDTTKALRRADATPAPGPPEATFADSRHSVMMASIASGGPAAESGDDATLFERDDVRPRCGLRRVTALAPAARHRRPLPSREARKACVPRMSCDRNRGRPPDVQAAPRLRHLSPSGAGVGPLRNLPQDERVHGREARDDDGNGSRPRSAPASGGFLSRGAHQAHVRRVPFNPGNPGGVGDAGAMQGLSQRPPRRRPQLLIVSHRRRSKVGASVARDRAPTL